MSDLFKVAQNNYHEYSQYVSEYVWKVRTKVT